MYSHLPSFLPIRLVAAFVVFGLVGLLGAAECGWEWCACKRDLGRELLENGSGSNTGPKYAPDREIDVLHLKLDITPDFKRRSVSGVSTLSFSPIAKPVNQLRLNAIDLAVTEVESSVEIEDWEVGKEAITITFKNAIAPTDEGWVRVTYSAEPKNGWYYRTEAMGYPEGDDHFFTQGEPERHQHWFPGYDYPNERFTSEVICHVPKGMVALSNGALVGESTEDGVSTFHWKQEKEHVNYLISVVGGYFEKLTDQYGDLDLAFYTPPSEFAEAPNSFRDTTRILKFFEKETGHSYPWAKYDNVCVTDFIAGGMENTSITTLTTGTLFSEASENIRSSHRLDAHEAAHQWFGDLVTCKDWSHLWLNEGFATYYTHLYEEEKSGRDSMNYNLYRDAERVLGTSDTKPIVWRGYKDPMEQFDYRAYPKGGWVLHMLRSQLGADLYRDCIREYLERNQFKTVVTADLVSVFEELSGQSWDRHFDQWVFHGGTPKLKVSYTWDQKRKQAKVGLEQTQKVGGDVMLFHLDVPIRFVDEAGGVHEVKANLQKTAEDFFFELPVKPKIVRIDPDYTILATVDFKPANPLLYAQLENPDDMMGRLFAAKLLGGRKDKASAEKLAARLKEDPFYGVRIESAKALAKTHTPEALDHLIALRDQEDARVRQEVVRSIGKFYDQKARQSLSESVKNEQNPDIVTEAVAALGKFPGEEARESILHALGRDSYRQAVAASAVKAIRAQADPELLTPLTERLEGDQGGFLTRDFGAALDAMAYLARDEEEAVRSEVRNFIAGYVNSPKDRLRPMAIRALGTLEDPRAIAVLKTFTEAGDTESPEYKAADGAIRSLSGEKKQADEVKDLRKKFLELQSNLRKLEGKVETMGKQGVGNAESKESSKESSDEAED
tara:strand:- start:1498 stop:4185 length:2688 start_codon:yes stop_codon:yes gene_type:complete